MWTSAGNGSFHTTTGCHSVPEMVCEIHLGLRKYSVDDGFWDPPLEMTEQGQTIRYDIQLAYLEEQCYTKSLLMQIFHIKCHLKNYQLNKN